MSEIIIREIEENDLEKGFLESLDFLRKASDIDKNKAKEILKKINMSEQVYGKSKFHTNMLERSHLQLEECI